MLFGITIKPGLLLAYCIIVLLVTRLILLVYLHKNFTGDVIFFYLLCCLHNIVIYIMSLRKTWESFVSQKLKKH